MADLNGDGAQDMFSGSWPGDISVFYGAPADKKKAGRAFKAPDILISKDVYAQTRSIKGRDGKIHEFSNSGLQAGAVSAADWDSDGDIDLIVGNLSGELLLFDNTGTARKPKFGEYKKLGCGKDNTTLPGTWKLDHNGPVVVDWDLDGDLDVLLGTGNSGVYLLENTGAIKKPVLAEPVELLPGGARFAHGQRLKIAAADWNNDGKPDLLIGNFAPKAGAARAYLGNVYVCLRTAAAEKGDADGAAGDAGTKEGGEPAPDIKPAQPSGE